MARTSRQNRIRRRAAIRAASVLRDPWVLLTCGLGAGVGWAVQLPAAAVAGVGAAMLIVAGTAKALTGDAAAEIGSGSPAVRRGTTQAMLVDRLAGAAERLAAMVPTFAGTGLGSSVVEAATGASAAVESARRLAGAIDAVDTALDAAISLERISPGRERSGRSRAERAAMVGRLEARRDQLLSRIEAAYLGAEEVRAKLLEVSAAMQTPGLDPASESGLAEVSANLEALRQGLAELESAAAAPGLPDQIDPTRPS